MKLAIREDIAAHMAALRAWLAETEDVPLETMDGFFAARLDVYEAHMACWAAAYRAMAGLLPDAAACSPMLDLGCGTGLELDQIFARFPALPVTGVDICPAMLRALRQKHPKRPLTLLCADYCAAPLGTAQYGCVVSAESLHHFTPEQKFPLFQKIHAALRPGGFFLEADYIACCDEEETLLMAEAARRRKRQGIPPEQFVHFDTPLTLEHELALLRRAGFTAWEAPCSINGATFVRAYKR